MKAPDRTGQVWELDTIVGNRFLLVTGPSWLDADGWGHMHPVFDLMNGQPSTALELDPSKGSWDNLYGFKRVA